MTKSSNARKVRKLDAKRPVIPALPADAPADAPALFSTEDVQGVLDLFNTTKAEGGELEAMRAAMMLSIAVASVNLGVAPQQS